MAIIAKYIDPDAPTRSAFEPASEGVHAGSIVDVQDLGLVYNEKFDKLEHKVKVVVELAATNSFDKHILVSFKRTLSLHPRAQLSKDILLITGKAPTEDIDIEAELLLCSVFVMVAHKPNLDDPSRPYQRVAQIWKGDGSYSPSGTYQPWRKGEFQIGRAVNAATERGKQYLQLYDAEGSELAKLWEPADIAACRNASWITCQYRDDTDGTIRIRKDSIMSGGAAS